MGLQDGGRAYLLDAISLAEMALHTAPDAFRFKVLLVLLYGSLGAPTAMLKWYNIMEIKNIQHESLSYLAFDTLCTFGCHDAIREICRNVIQFHEDMDKDGTEAISMAFHNGVYQRVPEYIESLDLVSRSANWGRAVVEDVLCEVGQAQTWDAIVECLSRQGVMLSMIASRPIDF